MTWMPAMMRQRCGHQSSGPRMRADLTISTPSQIMKKISAGHPWTYMRYQISPWVPIGGSVLFGILRGAPWPMSGDWSEPSYASTYTFPRVSLESSAMVRRSSMTVVAPGRDEHAEDDHGTGEQDDQRLRVAGEGPTDREVHEGDRDADEHPAVHRERHRHETDEQEDHAGHALPRALAWTSHTLMKNGIRSPAAAPHPFVLENGALGRGSRMFATFWISAMRHREMSSMKGTRPSGPRTYWIGDGRSNGASTATNPKNISHTQPEREPSLDPFVGEQVLGQVGEPEDAEEGPGEQRPPVREQHDRADAADLETAQRRPAHHQDEPADALGDLGVRSRQEAESEGEERQHPGEALQSEQEEDRHATVRSAIGQP